MALESANYINQLIETNPNGTDIKGQGDDHIRMIKKALKQTFPNLTGPVTVTQAQLNLLSSQDQFVRTGMVVMWSGDVGNIPSGWMLCNGAGSLSNGYPVPDLRDRFIVGAGLSYGQRVTGGAVTHAHSAYTDAQVVATTVLCDGWGSNGPLGPGNRMPSGRLVTASTGQQAQGETIENISFSIQNQTFYSNAHGHNVGVNAADSRPPFYALLFIVKA